MDKKVITAHVPLSLAEKVVKMDEKGFIGFRATVRILAPVNREAAAQTVQSPTKAPTRLIEQVRIGEK